MDEILQGIIKRRDYKTIFNACKSRLEMLKDLAYWRKQVKKSN